MSEITGSCLCGECKYESGAEPLNIRVCHCNQCQKATGSAFFPRVMVPLDGLKVIGPVGWFASGSGLRRGFCTKCGSTLFSERKSRNVVGVSLGTLDNADQFDPTCHIWMSSKQQWLLFDDALLQHQEGP